MTSSELQVGALAIVVLFPALAVVTVILRVHSRISCSLFGWDDGFVIAAMIISLGETYVTWMDIKTNYIGIHFEDIPRNYDYQLALKYNYAVQILYNPILAFVKTSILIFLLRLSAERRLIIAAIWSLITLNLGLMIAIGGAIIFQCTPISANWDFTIERHCIAQANFFVVQTVSTIVTDILVLILPFWIVIGLSIERRMKIAVIGIFFLGFLVTITGIIRLALLIRGLYFDPGPDPTYNIGFVISTIETNLAIITASVPALKPLFRRWFPSVFGVNRYRKATLPPKRNIPEKLTTKVETNNLHHDLLLDNKAGTPGRDVADGGILVTSVVSVPAQVIFRAIGPEDYDLKSDDEIYSPQNMV